MSSLSRRVASLEAKFGNDTPYVLVHPAAPIPEHDFETDDDYFRVLAAKRIGHNDFKLGVLRESPEFDEDTFVLIRKMNAFFAFIAKYTDRIGAPPNPLRPSREEFQALGEIL